jgi:hypothetical protein
MANAQSFPLVRGRIMRVTATDGCCGPAYGSDSSIVTEGFVSVALTANITEAEEIVVTNANGKACVRDPGSPTFDGYGVEITFCEVQPCLFSMITGQPVVLDGTGQVIGFKMNSKIALDASGFALEVWMGVPGVACTGDEGAYGYLLLPCISGGVIGDFTIENAAITFTVTGAATRDGNGWGVGPYVDTQLPVPLDEDDHLYVVFTTEAPPEATDGCQPLIPSGMSFEVAGDTVTLTIPRTAPSCYEAVPVSVDWGDGTAVETVAAPTATATHTYTANGFYNVDVDAGICPRVTFDAFITGVTVADEPAVASTPASKSASSGTATAE